jgi:hypothetical protein
MVVLWKLCLLFTSLLLLSTSTADKANTAPQAQGCLLPVDMFACMTFQPASTHKAAYWDALVCLHALTLYRPPPA